MTDTSPLPPIPLLSDAAIPCGFLFGAVRAGLKASGSSDFAAAFAEKPASAAAMFTSNKVTAAPLIVGRQHLERSQGLIRLVLVNAGNANCATGKAGIHAAQQVCRHAAAAFECDGHEVFPSSTGIIGVPLPQEKLIAALPALREGMGSSAAHLEQMARAIMTTDTRPKAAAISFEMKSGVVRLAGIAKGAGMIFPQLENAVRATAPAPHATMLAYIFTDVAIEPGHASRLLHAAVETTFNRISIDGDTSTNDTVLLMASGAGGARLGGDAMESDAFSSALHAICLSLAKQIVQDGEGIHHVVELEVQGALSDSDALLVARAIAHSPLVKTAWTGCDPNWGRILAAIGYADVPVDPARVHISFGNLEICSRGEISPNFDQAAAHNYLKQRDLTIHIDLGLGRGACRFWTTDLSEEYVRINSAYST